MSFRPSESGFIYLASPYTHADPAVRDERFQAVCRAAAALMREGHFVFSPIAHSHPIDLCFAGAQSGDFWKAQDVPILRHASRLVVLPLHMVGNGCPDIAVGFRGRTYLVEIKDGKRIGWRFTKAQKKFRITWNAPVPILDSVDTTLAWLKQLSKGIDAR